VVSGPVLNPIFEEVSEDPFNLPPLGFDGSLEEAQPLLLHFIPSWMIFFRRGWPSSWRTSTLALSFRERKAIVWKKSSSLKPTKATSMSDSSKCRYGLAKEPKIYASCKEIWRDSLSRARKTALHCPALSL